MKEKYKVGVVSLGCDKNRVDTEMMLGYFDKETFDFTGDPAEADVMIVNTCAFIESAKEEAVDTILEMAEYKKTGKCRVLAVTGCLPQRYMGDLEKDIPEIDILAGTANYENISGAILTRLKKIKPQTGHNCMLLKNDIDKRLHVGKRVLTTPYHYAYLKVSEGCDNRCTYCAIPKIRGRYTSFEMEALLAEAKSLTDDYGISELILVGQDVTRYGIDLYGRYAICELIEKLSQLDLKRIRILYCYPELVTDSLIETVASNPKVCKYIDIPLQHISDRILKLMGRRVDSAQIKSLIDNLRARCPGITVRSTFITGFPGETEEDFNELCGFLEEYKLDYAGFFAYSPEDGTAALKLPGHLDEKTKLERQKKLYMIQNRIIEEKAKSKAGKTEEVVYESADFDKDMFYGRTEGQAPDIDPVTYLRSSFPLEVGEYYKVKITGADGLDLLAETIAGETAE